MKLSIRTSFLNEHILFVKPWNFLLKKMTTYLLTEISNKKVCPKNICASLMHTLSSPKVCPKVHKKNPRDFSKKCSEGHVVMVSVQASTQHSNREQHPSCCQGRQHALHGSTNTVILQSRSQCIGTSGKIYHIIVLKILLNGVAGMAS